MNKSRGNSDWIVKFVPSAVNELKKLPRDIQHRIINVIESIVTVNPYIGEHLRGDFKGYYKIRVGDYRIIYTLENKECIILIVRISHRKDVYRSPL